MAVLPRIPGEDTKKHKVFREFGGINTQTSRTTIGDEQFAWIENVMPIGYGIAKVVPSQTSTLASITGTGYYFNQYNINGTSYTFVATTSGAAYQVLNSSPYTVTQIATVGTLSGSATQIAQWKNERILIIDTNGYWNWNGSTFTQINNSVLTVTVTKAGTNFSGRPTVVFSSGTATATAQIGVVSATLGAGGTNYQVNDVLTISGGTFATAAQLLVTAVNSTGVITGFSIFIPGDYTAMPANPASVTGGSGTTATFNLYFGVIAINVTAGGNYVTAPTITLTGAGGNGYVLTANLSTSPTSGTSIATYSGRVWIGSGRTLNYSAPSSYVDFSAPSYGGNAILSDETLISNINQLLSANNFLYYFGDASVSVIGDVRVSTTATIFSNTNLTPSVGTNLAYAISSYYRAIWYANKTGVYALYGATPKKESNELDGIFALIDFTKPFTMGTATINNIFCLAICFTYLDPKGSRPILCVYFDKKWFVASQGSTLKYVWTATVSGVDYLFGSDGTNIYQCFGNSSGSVSWMMQSKLYDDSVPYQDKQVLKFGLEAVLPATTTSLSASIDTETTSQAYSLASTSLANWVNNSGATVVWQNNSLQAVGWLATGYTWFRQDVSMFGHYFGTTVTSTTPAFQIQTLMWQFEKRSLWGS
jgi:hypothetical protein